MFPKRIVCLKIPAMQIKIIHKRLFLFRHQCLAIKAGKCLAFDLLENKNTGRSFKSSRSLSRDKGKFKYCFGNNSVDTKNIFKTKITGRIQPLGNLKRISASTSIGKHIKSSF